MPNSFFLFNDRILEFPRATYPDFVMYVQQFLERKNARNGDDARASVAIKHTGERERSEKENLEDKIPLFHLKGGHLFDRLMSNHILSGRNARKNIIDKINSNNSSSVEEIDEGKRKGEGEGEGDYHSNLPEKNNSVTTTPISVTYMLVALNMAVKTAAEERVDSLFSIAHILSKRNDQEKNINCFGGDHGSEIGIENSNSVVGEKHTESGIVASESNAYAPLDQITTASNNVETAHIDGSEEEADSLVSVRSVEEIVRELYDTCQVREYNSKRRLSKVRYRRERRRITRRRRRFTRRKRRRKRDYEKKQSTKRNRIRRKSK